MDGIGIARKKLIDLIIKDNFNVESVQGKTFNYMELLYVIQEMTTEEGKKYFSKGLTKRGHTIFREFVKYLLYRNIANFDSMVLITANKGLGKSSAAIMMAREWCKLLGIKFSPQRHIAYNNADLMHKLDTLKKFEPIICVSGDTKVNIMDMGGYRTVKIKDLRQGTTKLNKGFKILSMNMETKKLEYKENKGCVHTGKKQVYEIELKNGAKIEATADHLFLKRRTTRVKGKHVYVYEWKKLEDLKEEDDIVFYQKCEICGKMFINERMNKFTCSKKCGYERKKKYNIKHGCEKSKNLKGNKEWNKKTNKWNKKWRAENPEKVKLSTKKWNKNNPNYQKDYCRNRKKEDENYKIRKIITSYINKKLKSKNVKKDETTNERIGCSFKFYAEHLERQFNDKMTWKNHGKYWEIHHIKEIDSFNVKIKKERLKAFHYSNCKPVTKEEHIILTKFYMNKKRRSDKK